MDLLARDTYSMYALRKTYPRGWEIHGDDTLCVECIVAKNAASNRVAESTKRIMEEAKEERRRKPRLQSDRKMREEYRKNITGG